MLSITCIASCVLFLVLKSLALSIRFHSVNSKLLKVFYINLHVVLVYIDRTRPYRRIAKENIDFIIKFVDSRWLLYTQPIMSEGNMADRKMIATLDAVKKESRLSNELLLKIQC